MAPKLSPAAHDPALLALPAEKALADAVADVEGGSASASTSEDFEGAMRALADLARARRRLLPRRHGQRSGPGETAEPLEIAQ